MFLVPFVYCLGVYGLLFIFPFYSMFLFQTYYTVLHTVDVMRAYTIEFIVRTNYLQLFSYHHTYTYIYNLVYTQFLLQFAHYYMQALGVMEFSVGRYDLLK